MNVDIVTILILIDGFLQCRYLYQKVYIVQSVTILILIDGFLQYKSPVKNTIYIIVTILILIDGFLQLLNNAVELGFKIGHNPYFNRWFSAIKTNR